MMLTVMLECRNQESELAQTLSVLVSGAVEGLISDVVVLDRGSEDASARVADAAGCKFYTQWDLATVLRDARGEWLMLLEAGARPQIGWIDEIAEHIAMGNQAARFTPSRNYSRPILQRLFKRDAPLTHGLLMRKSDAVGRASGSAQLSDLAKGLRSYKLISEIIPAWAAARS